MSLSEEEIRNALSLKCPEDQADAPKPPDQDGAPKPAEALPAAALEMALLEKVQVGALVVLKGLTNSRELNGRRGRVVGKDMQAARAQVQLVSVSTPYASDSAAASAQSVTPPPPTLACAERIIKVKPQNLEIVVAAAGTAAVVAVYISAICILERSAICILERSAIYIHIYYIYIYIYIYIYNIYIYIIYIYI
jgi:hypothetical protein